MLLTAPLAALAVGAGFGAQALLQPAPRQRDLLEALIAQPLDTVSRSAPTAAGTAAAANGAPAPQAPSLPASLQAERAAATAGDRSALAVPEAGPELELEIRVALLKLPSQPTLAASGAWQLSDRSGRVLRSGGGGESVDYSSLLAQESELWLQTGPADRLLAADRGYAGRLRLLRGSGGGPNDGSAASAAADASDAWAEYGAFCLRRGEHGRGDAALREAL
ncbi:MAG: hypothetical protein ACKOXO_02380, partial [Cyanobium sp.]